jgi:hypothetical protein
VAIAEDQAVPRTLKLWVEPTNIAERDLIYGQGGADRAPSAAPFVFEKEDMDGASPKFVVRDANGTKWKVKVGAEARPETVATRFIWAVGYRVDEDYFVPTAQVDNMPKLRRGAEFVENGTVRDARWERMDQEKVGNWKWSDNPFSESRELNGLRVLMALFNNWDVKPEQNAIYETPDGRHYVVSDLGSTLGPTGPKWPVYTSRGDLERYERSNFITKADGQYVDFATPSWPMLFGVVPVLPLPYDKITAPFSFLGLRPAVSPMAARKVGKHIRQDDVVWMTGLLKQLTPAQIRQAFEAAHYSPEEVEGFARVFEARVQALSALTQ